MIDNYIACEISAMLVRPISSNRIWNKTGCCEGRLGSISISQIMLYNNGTKFLFITTRLVSW